MAASTDGSSRTERLFHEVVRKSGAIGRFPADVAAGWPLPLTHDERVRVAFPLFRALPRPSGGTTLTPPLAALVLDWETGELVDELELGPAETGARVGEPVGISPHEAIKGLAPQRYAAMRSELYMLYDAFFAAMSASGSLAEFAGEQRMRELLGQLLEPSLLPTYRYLAPGFVQRLIDLVPDPSGGDSVAMMLLIRDAESLALEHSLESVAGRIAALADWLRSRARSIVVVGEANSGKSYLINRMLDASVANESLLPDDRSMCLERDSNGWLAEVGASLVEARPWNHSPEVRPEVLAQLARADIGVLVTGVPRATECELLRDGLVALGVPLVIVVVNRMHLLDEADRNTAMAFAAHAVANVAPRAELFALTSESLSLVRERISETLKRDLRVERTRQVACQLGNELESMRIAAENGLLAARRDQEVRISQLALDRDEQERRALDWTRLETALTQRRLDLSKRLREDLWSLHHDLESELVINLRRSPDPRGWWDSQLSYLLPDKLSGVAGRFDAKLVQAMDADVTWLVGELLMRIEEDDILDGISLEPISIEGRDYQASPLDLADLQKQLWNARIGGAGLAAGAAFVTALPVAISVMACAVVAAEIRNRQRREIQRNEVEGELISLLRSAFADHADSLTAQLDSAYSSLLGELETREREWRAGSEQALLASAAPSGANSWEALVNGTAKLAGRLSAFMSDTANQE